jgi:spoIIIJ-associated protein
VEWVETTGKTVAEALEVALDRLGVAESDAEVVVIEEPRSAMFGLRRSSARIRARVRPVQARAKRPSRRPSGGSSDGRSRRNGSRGDSRTSPSGERSGGNAGRDPDPSTQQSSGRGDRGRGDRGRGPRSAAAGAPRADLAAHVSAAPGEARDRSRSRAKTSLAERQKSPTERSNRAPSAAKEDEMSIETQAELAESFVRGVVDSFGFAATVESSITDDVIQVRVAGEGLGLLVGPRGITVDALQELTRTAVQHRSDEHAGRIHVDVAGYRARRTAALQDFARRVAAEVIASGQAQALEPMNAVDRKAVHDAIGDVAGVATGSEGEDPRRYVMIRPAETDSSSADGVDDVDDVDDLETNSADGDGGSGGLEPGGQ